MKLIMFGITDPTMTSEEVKQILADSFGDSIGNVLEVPNEFFSNQSPTTARQKKIVTSLQLAKEFVKYVETQ